MAFGDTILPKTDYIPNRTSDRSLQMSGFEEGTDRLFAGLMMGGID
jgi:hypothetical protein